MGDPDGSYDFDEIPRFLKELENFDLIIGSRFLGEIRRGAMPFSHRYIGNPIIRILLRFNGLRIKETCTGFIGIRRALIQNLNLKQPGMEFSSEFLIRAKKNNLKMKEIPIIYYPREGKSKLNEIRDGLRHFSFLIKEAM